MRTQDTLQWTSGVALSLHPDPFWPPKVGQLLTSTTLTAVRVDMQGDWPLKARLIYSMGWLIGMTFGHLIAALFPSRIFNFGHIIVDGWKCRIIHSVKR